MPTVTFTKNLSRHVHCPAADIAGATVAECLSAYFALHPGVRSYVLDEQGAVRKHVALFIGGDTIADRRHQSDPVADTDEIYIMQALSGG
jgi:sulfur carrier protein ThiS